MGPQVGPRPRLGKLLGASLLALLILAAPASAHLRSGTIAVDYRAQMLTADRSSSTAAPAHWWAACDGFRLPHCGHGPPLWWRSWRSDRGRSHSGAPG